MADTTQHHDTANTMDMAHEQDMRGEHAFTLYCQGERVAAIAASFGVSQTTVRRWLTRSLRDLADDVRHEREEQVLEAIESQREILRTAWLAYEREQRIDDDLLQGKLDRIRRRSARQFPPRMRQSSPEIAVAGNGEGTDVDGLLQEEYERPRHPSQGARYLALAQTAQREIARLQGLYTRVQRPAPTVHITVARRLEGPDVGGRVERREQNTFDTPEPEQ